MAKGVREVGEFCWVNMLTPDVPASQKFFSRLFGWSYAEIPGMGFRMQVDGADVGGMFDLASPNTPPGTPPAIGVMVRIANAEESVKRVRELGGTAKDPMEIPGSGRMVECQDPNGAMFDLWEPGGNKGATVATTSHGAASWFETMTTDVEKVKEFYTRLFGWTVESNEMPGFTYTSFKKGKEFVAGCMQIVPEMGPMPPHWGVYFTVSDAAVAVKTAEDAGAEVFVPQQDIPGVGKFCGLLSPHGVRFYIIQYS